MCLYERLPKIAQGYRYKYNRHGTTQTPKKKKWIMNQSSLNLTCKIRGAPFKNLHNGLICYLQAAKQARFTDHDPYDKEIAFSDSCGTHSSRHTVVDSLLFVKSHCHQCGLPWKTMPGGTLACSV